MKKFLTLLLAFSLLLGLFSACTTLESSSEPSSEPAAEEATTYPVDATKLVWKPSDSYVYSSVVTPPVTDSVKLALENVGTDDALLCICMNETDDITAFLEEHHLEITNTQKYRNETYLTAAVPKELVPELYELAFLSFGSPTRPENYPEGVTDDLALTLSYHQREKYRVIIGTDFFKTYVSDSGVEKEKLDAIIERNDLVGCYEPGSFGGNTELIEATKEQISEEGYVRAFYNGERGYTGEIMLSLTEDQILSLAEDEEVVRISFYPEYGEAYFITTLENGELTNQTEIISGE